jgi:2-deoxy-D-gluconate 3-dehydrogenase
MEYKSIKESMDLSGKVAIVTGGALGIGNAIATRLAEAGAAVVIADRDAEKAKVAAAAFTELGWKASAVATDVSDEAQVEAMIVHAVSTFGSVDIFVNNAGIYPSKPILEATAEDFEKTIHVNLKGAFFANKAAAKQMIAQGKGGKIINITSIDALHPSMVGLALYDASKHGLWGFTKNFALELAPHGITVNAIAPGMVATPGTGMGEGFDAFIAKIPMGRMADADEIGKVALFLASDLSSYMTGSQVVVDGGFLLA